MNTAPPRPWLRNPDHWNATLDVPNGPVGIIAEPWETRFVIWRGRAEFHQVIDRHMRPLEAQAFAQAFAQQLAIDEVSMIKISTTPEGNLAFVTPYNPAAVEALKATVPSTDRQWDGANKRWVVTPAYGAALADIALRYYGVKVHVPAAQLNTARARTGIFKMLYLGRVKDRGSEQSAYGWADGAWKLVFPEQVLRDWFGAEKRPGEAATLYAILGLKPDAAGAEVKASWRRLIRQWHPDVSREPDAAEQFRAIQGAYETLSDPARRARYDAGLALERSLRNAPGGVFKTAAGNILAAQEYSPPLRCGYVMVEGQDRLGRFVVSRILEWQDITNERGEILVTSWPEGADMFQERWVRA